MCDVWLMKNGKSIAWLIWKEGLKLSSKLLKKRFFLRFEWQRVVRLKENEKCIVCDIEDEEWRPLVCRLVLTRWFADWVRPIFHLDRYIKWAEKCDIWMKNENCWFADLVLISCALALFADWDCQFGWFAELFWPVVHFALEIWGLRLFCCGMFVPAWVVWGFWTSKPEQSAKSKEEVRKCWDRAGQRWSRA